MRRVLPMVVALAAALAFAQDEVKPIDAGQTWSAIGARTLVPGSNLLEGAVGYPGLSVGFLRGVLPGLNVGGRAAFVYGVEGVLREWGPGFKAQALLKYRFLDVERVSLGVVFEPGVSVYGSYLQGTRTALVLPVGLRLGIAASSALTVAIHLDFPMWIELGQFGGFNFPILSGGGAEYFITSQLAVFARARIGPTLRTLRQAEVTFDASLGVAWRF
ncbi:MAG: hypothetical protein ACOZQL_33880 [Myxococcota bacterium]